jgi:branched-chain amino acid transport system ATP-binding protein
MLNVKNLSAWYGHSHILQNISLNVQKGEIVTLIGRNGAGKTTTLKTIMGLLTKTKGEVIFNGQSLLTLPSHARFQQGLAYVPEERRIVAGLTVAENLTLGLLGLKSKPDLKAKIEEIATTFPRLKERLNQQGSTLSGGEQQMLAIARATIANPTMILLDEPSEGIMPILVDEMFEEFQAMKARGMTILLVEQNVELALEISDRVYILDQGKVVHEATAGALKSDAAMVAKYCGV